MSSPTPKPGESLADLHPDLAAQWHPTRNGDLLPSQLKPGSNKSFWWICERGSDHEWQAKVANRTILRTGCPVCAGRKVVASNCLATLYPELAAQWHPTKNGDLTPDQVFGRTSRKVWWQCPVDVDHPAWLANPESRANGTGCPACGRHVVEAARRRPAPGQSLADLHPEVASRWDQSQNGDLTPSDVRPKSHQEVHWRCDVAEDHRWTSPIARIVDSGAGGCPFCAGKRTSSTNSLLAEGDSALVSLWDSEKNGDLKPSDVTLKSKKRVWWSCPVAEDHRWRGAVGATRSCPFCNPKSGKASSTNNFRDFGPEDAVSQWDWAKNAGKGPEDVTLHSNKQIHWRCEVAEDHRWKATPNQRASGSACPFCDPRGGRPSSTNNLRDHGPAEVVAEWDYEANGGMRPEDFNRSSGKAVFWQCSVDPQHRWRAKIDNRVKGRGCPECAKYGFNPARDGWIYLVRHESWGMLQIGISNNPKSRLAKHKGKGWTLVDLKGPMTGDYVSLLESEALDCLRKRGAELGGGNGSSSKFDGFTESWPEKTLALYDLSTLLGWVAEEADREPHD